MLVHLRGRQRQRAWPEVRGTALHIACLADLERCFTGAWPGPDFLRAVKRADAAHCLWCARAGLRAGGGIQSRASARHGSTASFVAGAGGESIQVWQRGSRHWLHAATTHAHTLKVRLVDCVGTRCQLPMSALPLKTCTDEVLMETSSICTTTHIRPLPGLRPVALWILISTDRASC